MMADDHVRNCFQNGITSTRDISAIRKFQQAEGCTQEEAIATHAITKMVGDKKIEDMKENDRNGYKNSIARKFGEDSSVVDPDAQAERVMKMAKTLQDFQDE